MMCQATFGQQGPSSSSTSPPSPDARAPGGARERERSSLANEEVVYLIFQVGEGGKEGAKISFWHRAVVWALLFAC